MNIYLDSYPSFGSDDCEALRILLRRVIQPGCRILEIGSWLGTGSTKVIIEELSSIPDAKLYCVDTWRGSPNVARHQIIAGEYDVIATFRHNVNIVGGYGIVRQLIMNSEDAADIVESNTFDLIFIDGDHSYEQTRNDIIIWRPKVRSGGILCGHDCECRPRGALRERILSAGNSDSIAGDGTSFAAIHPGVVLAVDEAFGGGAHLWSEEVMQRSDGTTGRATIWDVVVRK
jgi:predicted O-methyltransferase YrrM